MSWQVGERVLYVPTHANGKTDHKDCEKGTITSIPADKRDRVFVTYDNAPNTPKLTYTWNLEPIT